VPAQVPCRILDRNPGCHLSAFRQGLPRGWDARKVRAVIAHYERLTDEELAREIEEAPEVSGETLIAVPTELLPAVKKLIARHQKSA